jgi:hypothetical protein
MSLLRPLERLLSMLHGFPGVLVPSLMILFPVVRGCGTMSMCSQFVEFCRSLVRVIGHGDSHPQGHLHLSTSGFYKLFSNEHSGGSRVSLRVRVGESLLTRAERRSGGSC